MSAEARLPVTTGANIVATVLSIITVLLTVFNAATKSAIDRQAQAAQRDLQAFDEKLRERAAELDVLKEKTTRYTFLHTLLPDLLSTTSSQQLLTINLIRLTLTDDEAARFFNGFSQSADKSVQQVGNEGLKVISEEKTATSKANEHERQGFNALVTGKIDQAIDSFKSADAAYPTYHDASDIARLLETRRKELETPTGRQAVYGEILRRYSWKAPTDAVTQLKSMTAKPPG
jgi:hypothetical protein